MSGSSLIKSGHDTYFCVGMSFSKTQLRNLAAHPREFCPNVLPSKSEGAGNAGRSPRPQME
jgi:hypothetical protein